jgi:hypothetical protein
MMSASPSPTSLPIAAYWPPENEASSNNQSRYGLPTIRLSPNPPKAPIELRPAAGVAADRSMFSGEVNDAL